MARFTLTHRGATETREPGRLLTTTIPPCRQQRLPPSRYRGWRRNPPTCTCGQRTPFFRTASTLFAPGALSTKAVSCGSSHRWGLGTIGACRKKTKEGTETNVCSRRHDSDLHPDARAGYTLPPPGKTASYRRLVSIDPIRPASAPLRLTASRRLKTRDATQPELVFWPSGTREYTPMGLQLSPSSTVLLSGGSERSSPGPESPSSRLPEPAFSDTSPFLVPWTG